MRINLRTLYLYLFSFVGLLIVVVGCIRIVDVGIKTFVFKEADRYEIYPPVEDHQKIAERDITRQRQRDLSNSLSMIVVGLPLYLYHWKTIQKETKKQYDV